MKRIPATQAAPVSLYPEELVRRLAGVRALRYAKIEADQAALRASLKGLEYRLSVHDEALAELDARLTHLETARLARLEKGNSIR